MYVNIQYCWYFLSSKSCLIRDQEMELAQPILAFAGGDKAFFKVSRGGSEDFQARY